MEQGTGLRGRLPGQFCAPPGVPALLRIGRMIGTRAATHRKNDRHITPKRELCENKMYANVNIHIFIDLDDFCLHL
jgi:hypothetical protein